MNFNHFAEQLKAKLEGKLPGQTAQFKLAGEGRVRKPNHDLVPRKSAVIILLYPKNDRLFFPVIQRPVYNGVHSGQLALPGGAWDRVVDDDLKSTAIRELHEEIGVDMRDNPSGILGKLSELYIPPSNFLVEPFVAFTDSTPNFFLDSYEVESIIEFPLQFLLQETRIEFGEVRLNTGEKKEVPCFKIEDKIIWGATAMMLNEFRELLFMDEK